ncbi:inhibin beta E chain [Trichonephila clavata]|uniref:Inhibin beta E chain n=1 Tax=Trichonephila clavata TaxID=2740835 RepID=A0A8X6L1W0_TRICU|nr:inhibin beta E chain [Trichonephila clavata]
MKVAFQLVLFVLFTMASGMAQSSISSDEEMKISFRKRCDVLESTPIPSTTEPTTDLTMEQAQRDDYFKKAILDEMKTRILMALNMTQPRVINGSLPLLQSFDANSSSWDNQARNFSDNYTGYKNWNNYIIRSEIVHDSCLHQNGQQCLRFRIPLPRLLPISSKCVVELWLYKKENVTDYTITQIVDDPLLGRIEETFKVSNQMEREFWTRLDATYLTELATHFFDFELYYSSEMPILITETKKPLIMAFLYRD